MMGTPYTDLFTQAFLDRYPDDAASVIERADVEDIAKLLEAETVARADAVFRRMTPHVAAQCLAHLSEERAARLLGMLDESQAAEVLGYLEAEAQTRSLGLMPAALAKEVQEA
jgi:Mg/Co/Ni transporter MgtE